MSQENVETVRRTYADYRGEPEAIRDGGDQVVAVVQVGGTGRRSGAKAMARVAHVLTLQDR
jgi:ketosteroid isomerase-like protein